MKDQPELDPGELAHRLDDEVLQNKRIWEQSDDPRVAAAQMLSNTRHPTLSPEMSARIQARMLAAHRQTVERQRVHRPRYLKVFLWVSVAAAAIAIFSSVSYLLLHQSQQVQLTSEEAVTTFMPSEIALQVTPTEPLAPTLVSTSTIALTHKATLLPTQQPSQTSMPVVEQTKMLMSQATPTELPTQFPMATYTPMPSATPLLTETPQPPAKTMYALENSNVRSQPARDQSVITVLQQGEAIQVIGADSTSEWLQVQLPDGRQGWVAKFLLSIDRPVMQAASTDAIDSASSSAGENGDAGNSGNSDFGCDHPGNYCNAPRQNGTQPTPSNGNNGNGNNGNNGNGGNTGGDHGNSGGKGKP